MNLKFLVFSLLLVSTFSSWAQTTIDKNISIEFPGQATKYDTTSANYSVSIRYLNSSAESYLIMRMAILSNKKEQNNLPSDSSGLNDIYKQIITLQIATMSRKGFTFKSSSNVMLHNYSARKIIYIDSVSGNQNAESIFLFLNGINYVVTYSKVDTFIEKNKDNFMRSLSISNSDALNQIQPSSKSSSSYIQFLIYAILTIGFILFFRRKTKDKSALGINLNTVYCPTCQTKQPFVRIPKNSDQLLFGGTTCPKCQTKLDKYGRIIP
jgi:hypothetical protein